MVNNSIFKIKIELKKYEGSCKNGIKTWVTLTLKEKFLKQYH